MARENSLLRCSGILHVSKLVSDEGGKQSNFVQGTKKKNKKPNKPREKR